MAALDTALALPQRHDPAVGVGENLDLDMAGAVQIFLEVELPHPERLHGLALRTLEGGLELSLVPHEPHPLAAAARHRLEQHRVAESRRFGARLLLVQSRAGCTPQHRPAPAM